MIMTFLRQEYFYFLTNVLNQNHDCINQVINLTYQDLSDPIQVYYVTTNENKSYLT